MDITPDEYNSVKFYQDGGFYSINTYLRKNECNVDKLECTQAHIRNLDNLFAKTSKTDKILTVYRGESNVYEGVNLGFISTSKNLHTAKKFTYSQKICRKHWCSLRIEYTTKYTLCRYKHLEQFGSRNYFA